MRRRSVWDPDSLPSEEGGRYPSALVQLTWTCRRVPAERRDWMAFRYELETASGEPVEPPTLATAVPNWRAGDTIPLGKRTLRVIGKRDEDADQPPVLVVEEG